MQVFADVDGGRRVKLTKNEIVTLRRAQMVCKQYLAISEGLLVKLDHDPVKALEEILALPEIVASAKKKG